MSSKDWSSLRTLFDFPTSSFISFAHRMIEALFLNICVYLLLGFPVGSVIKNLSASAGEASSIPGSGRSPEGGHGNPLQCSCLQNPMDRGAWWVIVHGSQKSRTRVRYWPHTHISS